MCNKDNVSEVLPMLKEPFTGRPIMMSHCLVLYALDHSFQNNYGTQKKDFVPATQIATPSHDWLCYKKCITFCSLVWGLSHHSLFNLIVLHHIIFCRLFKSFYLLLSKSYQAECLQQRVEISFTISFISKF